MAAQAETGRTRLVSVIVPTNNRPAMLRLSLASIRALEGPDLRFEILVGDNGNAPETPAIAREFGAVYLKTSKVGAGPARNLGLRAATGDYFTFLDDDDILLPEAVRPHLALLDARSDLDAVIGQVIYTDKDLKPTSQPIPAADPGEGDAMLREMLGEWFPQVGTVVARIEVRETVGLFDEVHVHGEDGDWFLRLARARKTGFTPTACILFRGRPPGTFDQLNRDRAKAGRRIFLRHGLAERRIWRGSREFWAGYRARLIHFFVYFSDGAKTHARAGRYGKALINTLDAAYVFPFRVIANLVMPKPMRKALKSVIQPRRVVS